MNTKGHCPSRARDSKSEEVVSLGRLIVAGSFFLQGIESLIV